MPNDIFLSYRRDGGFDTAKHLYDLLSRDGYTVSFDIDALRNGDFDRYIYRRIDECKDFILVINDTAFERTLDPNFDQNKDWLRQELAYALKQDKNIIPIFLRGISAFPNNLPEDIKGVVNKNGPRFDDYFFDAFYNKLKKNFLVSKPHLMRSKLNSMLYGVTGALIAIVLVILFIPKQPTQSENLTSPDSGNSNSVMASTENTVSAENTEDVSAAYAADGLPNFNQSEFKENTLVDLGLSVLWYSQNVGEDTPSGSQKAVCFGWGAKKSAGGGTDFSLYKLNSLPNSIVGDSKYDIAMSVNCSGKTLRMPTKSELEQLVNSCTWEQGYLNGRIGYKVTSKVNGRSIFLPARGYQLDGMSYVNGNNKTGHCLYWSGTLSSNKNKSAYFLNVYSNNRSINSGSVKKGFCVRPVADK